MAALDGAVLRHRVSRHERKVGALRMDPDLSVMGTVADARDLRSVAGPVEVAVSWIRDRRLDPRFPAPDRFLVLPYEVGRRLQPGVVVAVLATGDLLRVATEPVGDMIRRCGLAGHRDLATTPLTRAVLADRDNTVALSAASAWEIGIKVARGRLTVPLPDGRLVAAIVQEEALERLDIAFDHVLAAVSLPPIHRDPFDRILVAQARTLGCPILTADPMIACYEVDIVW